MLWQSFSLLRIIQMWSNESRYRLIMVVSENLKLIHVHRAASCDCIWVERQNPSYLFLSWCFSVTQIHVLHGPLPRLSHSATTCSLHTHRGQNHRIPTGHKKMSLCACVCACVYVWACTCTYMQPQQSLLLNRGWVAREPAANEAKHFLHGEGQRAQLDVKHLTVRKRWKWHEMQHLHLFFLWCYL